MPINTTFLKITCTHAGADGVPHTATLGALGLSPGSIGRWLCPSGRGCGTLWEYRVSDVGAVSVRAVPRAEQAQEIDGMAITADNPPLMAAPRRQAGRTGQGTPPGAGCIAEVAARARKILEIHPPPVSPCAGKGLKGALPNV